MNPVWPDATPTWTDAGNCRRRHPGPGEANPNLPFRCCWSAWQSSLVGDLLSLLRSVQLGGGLAVSQSRRSKRPASLLRADVRRCLPRPPHSPSTALFTPRGWFSDKRDPRASRESIVSQSSVIPRSPDGLFQCSCFLKQTMRQSRNLDLIRERAVSMSNELSASKIAQQ